LFNLAQQKKTGMNLKAHARRGKFRIGLERVLQRKLHHAAADTVDRLAGRKQDSD
jgi:hypothetical protein